MAVAISFHSLPSISSHLYPSKPQKLRKAPPPIFISTNPSHVNLHQLVQLFASANLSCHRFPNPDAKTGRVEPVDLVKLRTAVDHSSVVVSVFCREEFAAGGSETEDAGFGGSLIRRAVLVSEMNGQLVGFGRAVPDGGLTAAIYDVAVRKALLLLLVLLMWLPLLVLIKLVVDSPRHKYCRFGVRDTCFKNRSKGKD